VGGRGGGLAALGNASVAIINSSVHDNSAGGFGGGLLVFDSASLTITGSIVANNTANWGGGGVFAQDTANVVITSSVVNGNTAMDLCGGGVFVGDGAHLNITNASNVHGNIARAAGGGGICMVDDETLAIMHDCTVHSNQANTSGGGLMVFGRVAVSIGDGCSITNNICMGGVGGGMSVGVDANEFRFGGMVRLERDSIMMQYNYTPRVTISGSIITNNTSTRGAGGGLAVASNSVVTLSGGTNMTGNRANASSGGAVMLTDNAVLTADGTTAFANNSVPTGFVGATIVAFGNSDLLLLVRGMNTKCSSGVYLGRTPCRVGEVLQHDACVCCPSHTFFDNNSCTKCPPNAACPGANIVEPLPGFWSSSPQSIQMHRCPLFKTACDYVNQTHIIIIIMLQGPLQTQ
jgi:hypothetical protein